MRRATATPVIGAAGCRFAHIPPVDAAWARAVINTRLNRLIVISRSEPLRYE
jgi:hypothetical protein